MVLFLCGPEQVKCSLLSYCVLYMHTLCIKGRMSPAHGASCREAKGLRHQEECRPHHLLVGVVISLCFCLWLVLIPLEVYLCPCVQIIPFMFHVAASGRPGGSFAFVNRSGGISSVSVEGCGSSILGKGERESAHLAHHAISLGSNLGTKTENYLSLITFLCHSSP